MSNFTYKLTTTKSLKVAGVLDIASMTVDVDGEQKKLSTLLSEYDGNSVDIAVRTKDEEELDEPEDSEE